MSAITIEQSWQNILSLTKTMEQSAANENWTSVADSATRRHKMIEQHFSTFAVGPHTASFYYQHLSQFLKKEEQLQQLTETAKKQALRQNLTLINNKKAVSIYQNT